MKNNFKAVSPIAILLSAIAYFVIGIIFIFEASKGIALATFVVKIILTVSGSLLIVSFLFNAEKRLISTALAGGFYLVLAIVLQARPNLLASSVTFIVGLWALLNFTWRFILCIQLYQNQDVGFNRAVIDSLISLIFGMTFIFNPLSNIKTVSILMGIYLTVYGLTLLGDFVREILKLDLDGKHIKRRIKWSVPVVFTAFVPQKMLNQINKSLEPELPSEVFVETNAPEGYLDTKLEVFVHMAPNIAFGFGHIDICFDNVVYSYGTYDSSTERFFGTVYDGVLVEMVRDMYLENCLKVDKERIISFNIWMSDGQINDMRDYICKFKENCFEWKCNAEVKPQESFTDPASNLYKAAHARFYKFKTGKFKTYFAVKTNCVQLADNFIGSSGLEVLKINGIITPGTYLAYLNKQFERRNSIVVKRNILV